MSPSKNRYGMYESKHTWYANNWFQSKLEARWAVFFDQIGLKWSYEPKEFKLSNGKKYTPDFWNYGDSALILKLLPVN